VKAEEQPILSVILPNYNHADVLPRALDALLAQEFPPDELIILDDGSTDASLSVIENYAARFVSIRVIANPRNLGVIPTLQRGLAEAGGRYVYFAASDDWVWPGFFARAVATLDAHPERGLFCADAVLVDARDGHTVGYRPITRPLYRPGEVTPAQARRLLRRIDNWILTGSTLFRRQSVLEAGGFDERLGTLADGYMARKIALTRGFCYAPVTAATWCISSHSASRVTAREKADQVLRTVPPVIAADPAFPHWYGPLFHRRWRFATARLAVEDKPFDLTMLRAMGPGSATARAALALVSALPAPVARFLTLALLWLCLRPTSLLSLLRTACARWLERRHG
jgi:hypothetical protein